MSDHGLRRVDLHVLRRVSKSIFDCSCLEQVVVMCACSVGIDIINLFRLHACFLHGQFHSHSGTFAVLCRGSNVVCVAGCAISHKFRVDFRASCFRMLQLFQNNNSGTLAQHESVSVLIKRTGSVFRIICCGKRRQGCKSRDSCRTYRSLCTAGYHYVRVSVLDGAERVSDAMRTGSTGCYHVCTFSFQAKLNGNISCRHVGNHQRNHQRIHLIRSLCQDLLIVCLHTLQTSDTGAHNNAAAERIFIFHVQSRIFESLFRRSNRIL